ncbi:MAG: glycine cleavage system protein GcvH [Atribacterota bacterium]
MVSLPEELLYTAEHFWVKQEEDVVLCGITDHAQSELGDVVFVEMPRVGTRVKKGERIGDVESVKTVSNLYAPLSGEVVAVNEQLKDRPELINKDPYGEGWIVKLKPLDLSEFSLLLSSEEYRKQLASV